MSRHYDELIWLDFVRRILPGEETARMSEHLLQCGPCQRRVEGLRRLNDALPLAGQILGYLPLEMSASPADMALFERARAQAEKNIAKAARDDEQAGGWFLPGNAPPASATDRDLTAALRVARVRLRTDVASAAPIIRWVHGYVTDHPGEFPTVEGPARATLAQLLLAHGDARAALTELDGAQPFLDDAPGPELEEARWEYVRATALHQRSRYDDALDAVRHAATIYREWEDDDRWRRSRILEAAILTDSGRAGEAVAIDQDLLSESWPEDDRALEAVCAHNYACDLLFAGHLDRVKPAFARATDLWRKTGQESMLFRVRCGLADLALAEGRYEEALATNLRLRKDFQTRNLPWDEIQRELRVLELFVRLGQTDQARSTCAKLVDRARALDLPVEAQRALTFLAQAEELEVGGVARVLGFVKESSRNPEAIWSAA
jgi:tetratricopeptide (TPR) repeat protein